MLLQTPPNVNQLIDAVLSGGALGLVFPLAPLDLRTFMDKHSGFAECRAFLRSASAAGRHLHSRMVVHTDIKPANFLLMPSAADTDLGGYQLELSDFGSAVTALLGARRFQTRADAEAVSRGTTTWPYRAPEICYRDVAFGPAADTWSIGVTAWEVLHGTSWASEQLVPTYVQYFGGPGLAKV